MNKEIYTGAHYGLTPEMLAQIPYIESMPHYLRRIQLNGGIKRNARFIYKYIAFDAKDDFSIKKVRDLIVNSSLYLAKPSEFNDPDEFQASITLTEDRTARRKWLERTAKEHIKKFPHTFPEIRGRGRKIEALVSRSMGRSIEDANSMNEIFHGLRDRLGVFCFSTNARSSLLWSHYANGHRGICIQFECTRCIGVLCVCHEVQYQDNFPTLVWPDDSENVMKPALTKSSDWAYEGEVRYISRHIAGESIKFNGSAVTGLIVGRRFSENGPSSRQKLAALLEERSKLGLPPLNIYAESRSLTGYPVRIRRIASL